MEENSGQIICLVLLISTIILACRYIVGGINYYREANNEIENPILANIMLSVMIISIMGLLFHQLVISQYKNKVLDVTKNIDNTYNVKLTRFGEFFEMDSVSIERISIMGGIDINDVVRWGVDE